MTKTLSDRINSILGRNCPAIGGVSAEGISVIRDLESLLAETSGALDDMLAMIYEGVPKEEWAGIQGKARDVMANIRADFGRKKAQALKPCPFCGKAAYKKASDVFCENPKCGIYEKEMAQERWHARGENEAAQSAEEPDECTNWVNLEPRYGVICGSWNKEGDLALCNECLESESPPKTSQREVEQPIQCDGKIDRFSNGHCADLKIFQRVADEICQAIMAKNPDFRGRGVGDAANATVDLLDAYFAERYKTAFELQKAASDGFKKMYEDLLTKYRSIEEECYGLHEGIEQLKSPTEWERDMAGTLATLETLKSENTRMREALRILEKRCNVAGWSEPEMRIIYHALDEAAGRAA
jgi:hypothetical protein